MRFRKPRNRERRVAMAIAKHCGVQSHGPSRPAQERAIAPAPADPPRQPRERFRRILHRAPRPVTPSPPGRRRPQRTGSTAGVARVALRSRTQAKRRPERPRPGAREPVRPRRAPSWSKNAAAAQAGPFRRASARPAQAGICDSRPATERASRRRRQMQPTWRSSAARSGTPSWRNTTPHRPARQARYHGRQIGHPGRVGEQPQRRRKPAPRAAP